MLSAQIFEDVSASFSIHPSIDDFFINNSITRGGGFESKFLKVTNDSREECEYRLAWEVRHEDEELGKTLSTVDAHTGELISQISRYDLKNAPTADHGPQSMPDQTEGGNVVLRNGRLTVYDLSDVALSTVVSTDVPDDFAESRIPICPDSQNEWTPNDAPLEVFQAAWMANDVLSEFDQLGIEFVDVHIGVHPSATNAISLKRNAGGVTNPDWVHGIPSISSYFNFGIISGASAIEYDVIAHELGHTVIRQYMPRSNIRDGSLHEGISDIFGTYIESKLEDNSMDWIYGDNIPDPEGRDLENTARNCFTDIQDLDIPHDRGEAIGHWFYLCTNGYADNTIAFLPMDIDEVMLVVLEALPSLRVGNDYEQFMEATVAVTAVAFGTCSDQFKTIIGAWDQICVPSDHPQTPYVGVNLPVCFTLQRDNAFPCEESNYLQVCIPDTNIVAPSLGYWNIIGRNSTEFESLVGMSGNRQNGGQCITITSIPEMPYYPQRIAVKYWHPEAGESFSTYVNIIDCDGDDPTCTEYYSTGLRSDSEHFLEQVNSKMPTFIDNMAESESIELRVYDLMGRELLLDNEQLSLWRQPNTNKPFVVILTYWDEKGNFVKSEKTILYKG